LVFNGSFDSLEVVGTIMLGVFEDNGEIIRFSPSERIKGNWSKLIEFSEDENGSLYATYSSTNHSVSPSFFSVKLLEGRDDDLCIPLKAKVGAITILCL